MRIVQEELKIPGFERVMKITGEDVGLDAIISIHSTTLGPAIGGTRIHPYSSFDEALTDVLRLSEGMTYKSALVKTLLKTGFGGGKSVIIADPRTEKTPDLLRTFGKAVNLLQGRYICAEDVGCNSKDCTIIYETTKYVCGTTCDQSSGNPSPFTAWGTFRGIQATMYQLDGTDSLQGKKIAIQGLGSVGTTLLEHLFWAGADLIVTDIDEEKAKKLARKYQAKYIQPHEILFVDCDLLSPCAMGGILNLDTIPKLRCRAVAGASNNQLLLDTDANLLNKHSILYAPDFVINAGGLINVFSELHKEGYDASKVRQRVDQIYTLLLTIYDMAKKSGLSTHHVAIKLAKEHLSQG